MEDTQEGGIAGAAANTSENAEVQEVLEHLSIVFLGLDLNLLRETLTAVLDRLFELCVKNNIYLIVIQQLIVQMNVTVHVVDVLFAFLSAKLPELSASSLRTQPTPSERQWAERQVAREKVISPLGKTQDKVRNRNRLPYSESCLQLSLFMLLMSLKKRHLIYLFIYLFIYFIIYLFL